MNSDLSGSSVPEMQILDLLSVDPTSVHLSHSSVDRRSYHPLVDASRSIAI